jgi:hypothetical protein
VKRLLALPLLLILTLAQSPQNDPWILYQRSVQPAPPTSAPSPVDLPSFTPSPPSLPTPLPAPSAPVREESPFKPGQILRGRMLTGVYLVPGKQVPVAVEVQDNPKAVLVGNARFDPTGRVWVELTTAVVGDKVYPVYAVALEAAELTQGLPAKVGDEAPTLLADLVRGSLGGISDFVKATLEATTVVPLPGGGQAVQKSVPGLEMFLLARAADLVAIPKDQSAILRTVKVDRDTPLFVLFLPGADQTASQAPKEEPGR